MLRCGFIGGLLFGMDMAKVEATTIIRFGLFEADLNRGTLTRQGIRLRIQEQPFRILEMLLRQSGEIVTREQLRHALWPEGTHVNFDGSLNAALKKLRAALQDDAENPRFVETVPRQGYRFVAPVHIINESPVQAIPGQVVNGEDGDKSVEVRLRVNPYLDDLTAAETHWDQRRAERTQQWFDFLLLAAGILFGSWLLFFIVYPVPRPSVQRVNRITNDGRIEEWGGIVTDGTRIFFLEREAGHWNLMQTSVEGGNAEKIAAPFPNMRIFAVSPDHSQFLVGQFMRRDEEMPLWLWPVQGGEPRRLGKATGHDPAWSPDGMQIVFVQGQDLYSVRRDGTQLRKLLHMQGEPHTPAWSPDSRNIRFTMEVSEYGTQAIWEVSAEGNYPHPILAAGNPPSRQSSGTWTADGKYFLFSGCEQYDCNLWAMRDVWSWFRRSRHTPVPLTSGPDALNVATPAQTGSRIFAFSFRSRRELQKFDPRTMRAAALSLDTHAEEGSVSPDGAMVVYSDRPDGSLWRSRTDGTQRLRLTSAPLSGMAPQWSPKGEQILFTGVRPGQARQIYIVASDGGALRPVLPEGWEGAQADWSPDGYRIAVVMRNRKTHPQFGLYTLEPTTAVWKEFSDSKELGEPRWSPDGRYIACVDSSNHNLVLVDVQRGKRLWLASGGFLERLYWSADGSAVYFQDQFDEEESVFRVSLAKQKVERVAGFGEILRGSAAHCFFSGLGQDGSLFMMLERGLTDIYALDLDLP
jgi:Tol biopolymer transport system component/DNA-binding winged helix-turn-helix (wHTH) protein